MKARNKGALKDRDKSATAGRGKGLRKEYEPRFCNVVVNQGSKGKSRTQIAVYLGISTKTLKRWEQAHPEFAEAMDIAMDYALAWWEGKAQRSLNQKHFQSGMLNKMMASRYPERYGERSSVEVDMPITVITRRIIDAERPQRLIEAKRDDE
jgi:hypothetical protein